MKETIRIVCIIALLSAMMMPAAATTWYVHDGESIQAAIDGASSGDTVFVYNGTYDIFSIWEKSNITLRGEGADVVTLDGGGDNSIRIDNSHGCIVEGFKVINPRCGIRLGLNSPNCTFRNNIIDGTSYDMGILIQSPNTTFVDNVVLNATGIYSAMDISTGYNTIVNNTFKGATNAGITLDYDDGNNIVARNNIISNGYCGIEMFGAGEGSQIYLNNLVDNGVTVTTSGESAPTVTYWNSTEPIAYTYNPTFENYLGNYWGTAYGGTDGDGDGIGNTPYPIPEISGDYDYHPLMEPFENYPAPPPSPADLTPTAITPNCWYLFDGENNEICALIENNGGPASAFSVSFDINGDTQEVAVTGLPAGENTTVYVTDTTIRSAGDIVTINVTSDCNNEVTEDNETNNVLSSSETVVYNGYKGKRYTGGEDITTKNTFDLNGDLVYSAGDSYYLSSYSSPNWTTYDASWTDAELLIPATATVVDARLYVPYTWDKVGVMSSETSLTFNTAAQTPDAHYLDEKMYGSSYPYGMLVYDVTSDFDTTGNIANLTNSHNGGGNVSMRGMMLVVVYEDATEPRRQIFVNEEFDLIYGGSNYGTTPEEATAWAPITGAAINPALTANARLITFAPGADGTGTAGEGELIFNGQTWNDEWTDNEVHQIGISDRDVTAFLQSTGNEVGIRSNADWMEASNAILVVEENIFANNIYLVEEDSSASYGDTTTVEVYADTTDMHQGGQFYLAYPAGANITDVTFDSMWPYVTKDLTTYPEAVFVTFRKDAPMVNDTQLICTLSVQCENSGYSQGDMHFALSGEVAANRISELYDDGGGSLTDVGWHDGTFTCMNLPDLVVTDVFGEQQGTGDDYIVHYTVTNEGNAASAAGHITSLNIGEIGGPYTFVEDQAVPDALAPGESYTGTFGTVVTMTIPNDEMNVCADSGSIVMELDETNNGRTSIYPAGIELSVNVLDDGECVEFQEQFLVNIDIDPRNIPVYGIQYVLSFDNTVLHAEWQNEGTFLNSDGAETTMYINTIDNGAGTISFAATRVGDVGGIANPSGTLAVIKFTASQQGASSTLNLSEVVAANNIGNEIDPVDLIDDEVCISANIAPIAIGESLDMYNNDGQKYICKVYFDGTASNDPDGTLVNWRWSFGDGNYGTGEMVDHVYQSWNWIGDSTGEYEPFSVSLTVTDDADPHQLDNTTSFDVMVYTAGDANADGKVNILDATIVGLEWGETTIYGERTDQADLNNDGNVNILDAVIIGTCWGHTAW